MLGGADNPNGELPSYITGANIFIRIYRFLNPGYVYLSRPVESGGEKVKTIKRIIYGQ